MKFLKATVRVIGMGFVFSVFGVMALVLVPIIAFGFFVFGVLDWAHDGKLLKQELPTKDEYYGRF